MFIGATIPSWVLTWTTGHTANGWEVEERFLFDVQDDGDDDDDDGDEDADFPEEADECVDD